jgi:phospholipid-translocating ATPase
MIFKKIAMEHAQFTEETIADLKEMLIKSCRASSGPCGDVDAANHQEGQQIFPQINAVAGHLKMKQKKLKKAAAPPMQPQAQISSEKGRKKRKDQHFIIRDLILALSLCHNVTPVYPDEADPLKKEFQASSPDEVALVKFADSLDMQLVQREELYVQIKNANHDIEEYDILANFPFSSETKRMGIIVRHRGSNKIVFYLKGAETVMEKKIRPN